METQLLTAMDNTSGELLQLIAAFPEDKFNTIPFEGSWTAAQVAEHLIKAGCTPTLYGNVTATTRQPDEKIAALKELFLNFEIKMTAPSFIQPSATIHKKQDIVNDVTRVWADAKEAAGTLNLSETCTDFEFPGFGNLTRLEWINFMVIHTQRHIHQLKNISRVIESQ
ncbi:DinB family protein [Chitinophaga sp. MM2321]|uniref:DinB family protein n=1 Tax=Chitinophaga sp. MM2321 TaxID=3137178 RepID=UPI0032D56B90